MSQKSCWAVVIDQHCGGVGSLLMIEMTIHHGLLHQVTMCTIEEEHMTCTHDLSHHINHHINMYHQRDQRCLG